MLSISQFIHIYLLKLQPRELNLIESEQLNDFNY